MSLVSHVSLIPWSSQVTRICWDRPKVVPVGWYNIRAAKATGLSPVWSRTRLRGTYTARAPVGSFTRAVMPYLRVSASSSQLSSQVFSLPVSLMILVPVSSGNAGLVVTPALTGRPPNSWGSAGTVISSMGTRRISPLANLPLLPSVSSKTRRCWPSRSPLGQSSTLRVYHRWVGLVGRSWKSTKTGLLLVRCFALKEKVWSVKPLT